MYGTVALCRMTAEQVEPFRTLLAQQSVSGMDGWIGTDVLLPDDPDGSVLLVVRFRDRASYEANASSPEQHERYLQLRALLESDPVWHDGEWIRVGSS